jgi:integrase
VTIGEMIVLYERNHTCNLKDRKNISSRLQRYIAPFAALELGALTKIQVISWHVEIGRTRPNAANSALQTLRAMYQWAQDAEVYDGKNPADRVKKFPKRSRERFIQSNELPWLLKSLSEEHPRTETFFLCLLLTGARRDEARTMQWMDLDLDRALWHKPTTKTSPHTIPLPAQLVTKLRALPRVCEWVFPASPNPRNGFRAGLWSGTAVEVMWGKIRRRVGLRDVRIHDLRRTAASWLSINGSNIQIISAMLNHKSLTSTQIYARLSVEPVRQALDNQCERMLGPAPSPVAPVCPVLAAPETQTPEWPG